MQSITLEFPRPSKKLNAHNTGSWRGKSATVKARRNLAMVLTKSAMNQAGIRGGWRLARISYLFKVPDNIRRDLVNMLQQEKATVDGIVDAGLICGDHWQVLRLGNCGVEISKTPGTVITIEELKE